MTSRMKSPSEFYALSLTHRSFDCRLLAAAVEVLLGGLTLADLPLRPFWRAGEGGGG